MTMPMPWWKRSSRRTPTRVGVCTSCDWPWEPLGADKREKPVRAGLAVRPIARVGEYCCLNLSGARAAVCRAAPPRSWWRRADVVIAASLLVLALGLGVPALLRARVGL